MENSDSSTHSMPKHWFPYTKLQPPQHRANFIPRIPLQNALLEAVQQHRITLIAAPAGSGKTSLAGTLIHSNLSLAWATLDTTDNDFPIFILLLVAVLQPHLREDGRTVLTFVQTVPNAETKTAQLATLFINQLLSTATSSTILVLDDYHVIENPAIHNFIAYLVDYLPDTFHIVLATRYDPALPFARLRARAQLAEFRLSQLRFGEADATTFLNQLHHLDLNAKDVSRILHQTEGWVAGLQLLSAVLVPIKDRDKRSAYIQALKGVNRSIFALLAEEVLALQPPEIQEFLLDTSVLLELTPTSCQAVTEQLKPAMLLTEIYERNLFLHPLSPDSHEGPFVYHQLFGGFLQQRLREKEPERWQILHRRAATVAASPEQALHHLLSAELWEDAATHLEAMAQLDMERRFLRRVVANAIEGLPEVIRSAHPWLLLYVAQFYSIAGHPDSALPWRNQAAQRFREMGDELGEVEVLMTIAIIDALDHEEHMYTFRQKMESVGHLMRLDQKVIYHGAEMWHAVDIRDWDHLTYHLNAELDMVRTSRDRGALTMASLTIGPQMLFNLQGVVKIEDFIHYCIRIAHHDDWILLVCAHLLLGTIRYFQGRIHEAEQALRRSHELLEKIGGQLAWVDDQISWLMLSLALTRRHYHAFDAILESQSARWERQEISSIFMKGFLYLHGRSLWLRGRISEAEIILTRIQSHHTARGYQVEDKMREYMLAGLICMARGESKAAEQSFQNAVQLHTGVRHTVLMTDPRLALATLHSRQGRWHVALQELRTVLDTLKKQGVPGVILQEGESVIPLLGHAIIQDIERETLQPLLDILRSADDRHQISIPHSNSHLTPREVEVLRLLATGATNRAIGEELVISERTVKAHMTQILTKLDATTRTEAVSKATRLGLL
jgi:LuxR family transcriptional regulator, maltose regulon positive regulatory protein